ncbi:MAG: DUF2844 domain-containing protein [Terracidiphilus sp.]
MRRDLLWRRGLRLAVSCTICVLALGLAPLRARAELGGVYEGIGHDQEALHATLAQEEHTGYTLYTLTLPGGIEVREYYSQHSGIFAVSWTGKNRRPDMRQILGSYFERFSRTPEQQHRPVNQVFRRAEPDFVLESRGEMRRFSGRAFLPAYVPQEVSLDEIR